VEAQQNNPHSLLWWMKRLIALRKRYQALSRGSIEFLYPENPKVLAFIRSHDRERLLVVNNLSRFVQYVELDLSEYRNLIPTEVIGRNEFPPIGEQPYLLTLGPHSTYWFSLEEPQPLEIQPAPGEVCIPVHRVPVPLEELFRVQHRPLLADLIPPYLTRCRWFGGKARSVKSATVTDTVPFPYDHTTAHLVLVRIGYVEGEPETYVLPLAVALGDRASRLRSDFSQYVVAHLQGPGQEGVLYEVIAEPGFHQALLESVARRRHFKGTEGELTGHPTRVLRQIQRLMTPPLSSAILRAEQSNTSINFGDWLILKLLRRVEEGINLDLEIGLFLTEKSTFAYNPPVAGHLEYRYDRREPTPGSTPWTPWATTLKRPWPAGWTPVPTFSPGSRCWT